MEYLVNEKEQCITLQLTADEWDTLDHVKESLGSTFFQDYLRKFLLQRAAQKVTTRNLKLAESIKILPDEAREQITKIIEAHFEKLTLDAETVSLKADQ